jgi:hypothetical protein
VHTGKTDSRVRCGSAVPKGELRRKPAESSSSDRPVYLPGSVPEKQSGAASRWLAVLAVEVFVNRALHDELAPFINGSRVLSTSRSAPSATPRKDTLQLRLQAVLGVNVA